MSARIPRCWLGSLGVLGFWGAALGLCTQACLRPSEERARQDQEVGSADDGRMSVEVEGGHAVVRELDTGYVSLWASAPRLRIDVRFLRPPPDELLLSIYNCMPEAQLSGVPVLQSGRDAAGVCWFRLGPLAGAAALGLRVEPPDSERGSPFRFAVMSDVQEAIDGVQDIYDVLNLEPDVDFLLGAGDLTQRGTAEQLERFQQELQSLKIPYYTTLGNHELGETPTLYHRYFGRGSQSFAYKGVRFSLIDSASATLDPIVFGWLDDWLTLGAGQLHVVAMHIPPLDPIGVRNGAFASRNEAAKLLARLAAAGVDLTLYGHIHSYYHFDNAGIPAFISGGGGAIPEKFDNIGRHFLIVDADPLAQRFEVRVVRVD